MNSQLQNYYKDYILKCQKNKTTNQNNIPRYTIKDEKTKNNINKLNQESNECITLFLECLLSCNNVEKFNTEIF